MSPVYAFILGILIISLPLTVRFPKYYVFFWFRDYNFVYIFLSLYFVLRVLPIKFFEVPYSIFGFFISLSVECSPQHVVHRCHHLCSSVSLRVQYSKFEVFHDDGYSDCGFFWVLTPCSHVRQESFCLPRQIARSLIAFFA